MTLSSSQINKRRITMPEITVKGMSCGHCAQAVTRALESLAGVSEVRVDLATGKVTFAAATTISPDDLARTVRAAGYELAQI